MYRAVCGHCFRTFMVDKAEDGFCWKCGQALIYIRGEEVISRMKVIYEFEPDEDNNDSHHLSLVRNASRMFDALHEIDNIRRKLYKGYVYYDSKDEDDDDDSEYSRINVELLIDNIADQISDSGIFEELD